MGYTADVFSVLIASPSDVVEDRSAAEETIYEWNYRNSKELKAALMPAMWEKGAIPAFGRPQGLINKQLVESADLLIGLFWTRFGSDTGVAPSGTVEEIDLLVSADKPALLYFSDRPVVPGTIDLTQMNVLREYKKKTYSKALVGSYSNLSELRERLFHHLTHHVKELKKMRGSLDEKDIELFLDADLPELDVSPPRSEGPLKSSGFTHWESAHFSLAISKEINDWYLQKAGIANWGDMTIDDKSGFWFSHNASPPSGWGDIRLPWIALFTERAAAQELNSKIKLFKTEKNIATFYLLWLAGHEGETRDFMIRYEQFIAKYIPEATRACYELSPKFTSRASMRNANAARCMPASVDANLS